MKITSRNLKPGAVMMNGEVVEKVWRSGSPHLGSMKAEVTLRNPATGKTRWASWNWYGTLHIKSNGE